MGISYEVSFEKTIARIMIEAFEIFQHKSNTFSFNVFNFTKRIHSSWILDTKIIKADEKLFKIYFFAFPKEEKILEMISIPWSVILCAVILIYNHFHLKWQEIECFLLFFRFFFSPSSRFSFSHFCKELEGDCLDIDCE